MAFADATAIVSADFSRFQREFGPGLRAAVTRVTPVVVRAFTTLGRAAGRAFVDGVTSVFDRLTPAAARAGRTAGRAFALAAEESTKDIDIGFNAKSAQAAKLGQTLRQSLAKQLTRVPVSFASTPPAREVGRITGQRFRAGAMEYTTDIPVTFNTVRAERDGTALGRRIRSLVERETSNVTARVKTNKNDLNFFTTLTKVATAAGAAIVGLTVGVKLLSISLGVLGAAASSVQLLAFVADLAPLAGLLAAIPALITTFAAGMTVLGVSFERIGQQIKSNLVPAFSGLRDQIARTVTAGFAGQLREMGAALAGPVRTGALAAASALNQVLLGIIAVGQQSATGNAISKIFASTALAFRDLAAVLPSVLVGFRDIAVAVLPAFNQISSIVTSLIGRFGAFLSSAAASGQALAWVNGAIQVLSQLGQILQNVGTILTSVFTAAQQVGGGALTLFVQATNAAADFLSSTDGMNALVAIFSTLRDIGTALRPVLDAVLSNLGTVIAALAPAIVPVVAALGQLGTALANSLGQILTIALPAVAPLLTLLAQLATTLVQALTPALVALEPLLTGLVSGLVSLLTPLGPIITQIGTVLAGVIGPLATTLGQIFAQIGPPLGDLVAALGVALMPLLNALVPIFNTLLTAIQPMIPVIAQLIPPITELVIALTPAIADLAQLAVVLVQVLAPLIHFLAESQAMFDLQVLVPVIHALASAITFLSGPLEFITNLLTGFGDAAEGFDLGKFITEIRDTVVRGVQEFADFVTRVRDFLLGLPAKVGQWLAQLPQALANAFTAAVNFAFTALGVVIGTVINFFIQLPDRIMEAISSLRTLLVNFFTQAWQTVVTTTTNFVNNLITFVRGLPTRIVAALQALPNLVRSFFSNLWNDAVSRTKSGVDSVVNFVKGIPLRIAGFASTFLSAGKTLMTKLLDGLLSLGSKSADFVASIGRALKRWINDNVIGALERGINSALPFDVHLPRLAKGALLTDPTVALIAEAGPEVVIPLSDPARARELAAESGLDRMLATATPTVNVSVRAFFGTQEVTNLIRFEIDTAMDNQGQQLAVGTRGLI